MDEVNNQLDYVLILNDHVATIKALKMFILGAQRGYVSGVVVFALLTTCSVLFCRPLGNSKLFRCSFLSRYSPPQHGNYVDKKSDFDPFK